MILQLILRLESVYSLMNKRGGFLPPLEEEIKHNTENLQCYLFIYFSHPSQIDPWPFTRVTMYSIGRKEIIRLINTTRH